MNANELMIGDWVHFTNSLNEEWDAKFAIIDFMQGNFLRAVPIPLTAEILEKNGYSWAGSGDSTMMLMTSYMEKGVRYNIYVGLAKQTISIYVAVPKFRIRDVRKTNRVLLEDCGCYVHELQHALRLCGLNDLADNFKV